MTPSETRRDALVSLLDVLLPGGDGFPPASAVGLAGWLLASAEFSAPARAMAAALPGDFLSLGPAEREAVVLALEAARPDEFSALVTGAYSGYYIDADVLAALERLTAFPARAPQPLGYDLAPFDAAILEKVKARPPSWRNPEQEDQKEPAR